MTGPLRLKHVLAETGIKQGVLADVCGLSRPALNAFINRGLLPLGAQRAEVEQCITRMVRDAGGKVAGLFEVAPPGSNTAPPVPLGSRLARG